MPRTISIKGTGKVTLSPDLAVVSLTLRAKDKDYEKTVSKSEEQFDGLTAALLTVGFDEKDIKTESYNVSTEYESVRDEHGNYKNVFSGYVCVNQIRLEFALDTERLSDVLSAIAKSVAEPELNISFTVKDRDKAKKQLLESAAKNARETADILAAATGAKVLTLLSVEYGMTEHNFSSRTNFAVEDRCMALGASAKMSFNPDDITVSDSAVFVWEIG